VKANFEWLLKCYRLLLILTQFFITVVLKIMDKKD